MEGERQRGRGVFSRKVIIILYLLGCLSSLLREVVSELTLTDSSTTTTSLLRSMCHHDDCVLLGSWLEETDHQDVEEMVREREREHKGLMNDIIEVQNYSSIIPNSIFILVFNLLGSL